MDAKLLEKAVTEDKSQILLPVCKAAYALDPISKLEAFQIANDINEKLGYNLFEDLYYPRLIIDFSRVARAVQYNAFKSK